ncbi:redoxin domain-containing protein [Neolewinella lacunae]|uniref:Redoxin domain-containing protein n=1 Tax=Neolewinella lacunae TaxID=1517758 RepID=A0A923PJ04_9BACT|nr:redoxin domain-containing protein [Neolewinella lacunae]MBC6993576.1 redoxin domain-containing protein [Neolewinella lacunae]MDN3636149.1 redoxin domain-containing protein [Neolewinella lacunae]
MKTFSILSNNSPLSNWAAPHLLRLVGLLLLTVASSTVALAQANRMVSISGKSFTAPDTLVLIKPYEDLRYNGVKIPVNEDSTFHYTFNEETSARYELIYLSEFKMNLWREFLFFADEENIRFDLYDRDNRESSLVEGSEYTTLWRHFVKIRESTWMPVFMSAMEQASGLPEVQARYKRDSLNRELVLWEFYFVKEYPTEIEMAVLYDNVRSHKENRLLQEDFARQYEYLKAKSTDADLLLQIKNSLRSANNALIGKPFSDFFLLLPESDSLRLSKIIPQHKYTIIDMWSPWCSPCIKKSRLLESNYQWMKENGMEVIGIIGGIENEEKYKDAAENFKYPWKNYSEVSDHQSLWSRYGFDYGGGGQVLINRDGTVEAINPSIEDLKRLLSL